MKNFLWMIAGCLALSGWAYAKGRSGQEIFNAHCQACHSEATAAALKAPLVHDEKAWQPYIDKALAEAVKTDPNLTNADDTKKKATIMNELVKIATQGTSKGMPPKGTCMDCDDDELKAAIEWMSSKK